jgi:hypothetical protein
MSEGGGPGVLEKLKGELGMFVWARLRQYEADGVVAYMMPSCIIFVE